MILDSFNDSIRSSSTFCDIVTNSVKNRAVYTYCTPTCALLPTDSPSGRDRIIDLRYKVAPGVDGIS